MADKNTLKNWFKTGLKPLQEQFYAWIDSYWHKEEQIPITAIADIEDILNAKADVEAFESHLTDENAHVNKADASYVDTQDEALNLRIDNLDETKVSVADFNDFVSTIRIIPPGELLILQNQLNIGKTVLAYLDSVIGLIEGQLLNAGTYYGGDPTWLSNFVEGFIPGTEIARQAAGQQPISFDSEYAGDVLAEISFTDGFTFVGGTVITLVIGANDIPSPSAWITEEGNAPGGYTSAHWARFKRIDNNEYTSNKSIGYWR